MLIQKIKNLFKLLNFISSEIKKLSFILTKLHKIQESIGRVEVRQLEQLDKKDIHENEVRVFSQWGEDGIIQFLLRHTKINRKIFVEFGVQNYTESNTRFLLINNNWSGLVIDGSEANISYIKNDPIYWQYNLKAVQAFIDRDNINKLLTENGVSGEIGLLSIDIDGNDYWVWQAIDVVNPAIVVIEYNARFGKEEAVTVPYDPYFERSKAHYSNIYYGASLKALYLLGQQKGYTFVGCNTAGNNAFFIRNDLKPSEIKELSVDEGYIDCNFQESRDKNGKLAYLNREEEKQILASLPLEKVE